MSLKGELNMFCSNCGKEASGKFCCHCGSPLDTTIIVENQITSLGEPESFREVNGVNVNMTEIIQRFGKHKIDAIKYLVNATDISLKEGKKIIDEVYDLDKKSQPKKTWREKTKEDVKALLAKELEDKERIAQMDKKGIAYCPKCLSTDLSANKKGFGFGKAVVGGAAFGLGAGLLTGGLGSNKVKVTCLKCGYQFYPGQKK